jgi:hypothetical protein
MGREERPIPRATFTYDGLGRLTAAAAGGSQITYALDAFGRVSSRTQGGQTWTFTYEGTTSTLARVVRGSTTTTTYAATPEAPLAERTGQDDDPDAGEIGAPPGPPGGDPFEVLGEDTGWRQLVLPDPCLGFVCYSLSGRATVTGIGPAYLLLDWSCSVLRGEHR